MKLMHPWFQRPVLFSENRIQVLVIENRGLFSRMVSELCAQSEGEKGGFVLSEEDALLECASCLDVILDFFHLSPDRKRLQARFQAKMKAAAQQELQLETAAMQAHLQEYLRQVMALFDYPAEVEQEGDIGAILKACGPRLSFDGGNTAENLLDYMAVCQDLGGVRCFVLVNLKSYLAGNELQLFYEGICDRKLHVLLLESDQRETASEKENIRLIDKDFCELFLANRGEV